MNLAFLLHLYQPPTQTAGDFKSIAHECYIPLIKLIKSRTNAKFTLNTPLSLLEQFDQHGLGEVIATLKDLVETDRVEITGSAAYHPLLTRISDENVTRQVLLNEYGLGYYLGQRQGFEGEMSIMIKDIKGFFPPEMAINKGVLANLNSLNYEWVAVDPNALVDSSLTGTIYSVKDMALKVVVRDKNISDIISFKRDIDTKETLDYLAELDSKGAENVVVSLDAEVFGHHNKDGIYYLDNLMDLLLGKDYNLVSISDMVSFNESHPLAEIRESTWSTLTEGSNEQIYPFWDDKKNKAQHKLWELLALTIKTYYAIKVPTVEEGYENLAIWKPVELAKLSSSELKDFIRLEVLVNKAMHSDQFWWASGKTIYDKQLFSIPMVKNALAIYKEIAAFEQMSSISGKVNELATDILTILED